VLAVVSYDFGEWMQIESSGLAVEWWMNTGTMRPVGDFGVGSVL